MNDIFDPLDRLTGAADNARLAALTELLAERASESGTVDVLTRTVDSPVGPLLLAATSAGLVRVAYASEDHDRVLSELAQQLSPRILWSTKAFDGLARQLDEYFTGRRHDFQTPVDLQLITGFRREVLDLLPSIPYGQTRSYADLAAQAGRPTAVRAVGSACGHNPVPIVVPCHRVVRSDGSLGGYLGGLAAKQALLTLEAGRVA